MRAGARCPDRDPGQGCGCGLRAPAWPRRGGPARSVACGPWRAAWRRCARSSPGAAAGAPARSVRPCSSVRDRRVPCRQRISLKRAAQGRGTYRTLRLSPPSPPNPLGNYSAVMPYLFNLFLGVGLLVITLVSSLLQFIGTRSITILGQTHSLDQFSAVLLYGVGVTGEVLLLSAIYLVMPVGRLSLRHALMGGATATFLWEISRHILVWYYSTMSQIQVVYGSLTTSVAILLSVEIGALV